MGRFVYAVARGHKVGIYDDWNECKLQVTGFQNARYKKFQTHAEAEQFINEHSAESSTTKAQVVRTASSSLLGKRKAPAAISEKAVPEKKKELIPPDVPIVYTDGACSNNGAKNKGKVKAGWGVYWGPDHEDNSCGPVMGDATNNRGELQAVKEALKQAIDKKLEAIVVRTDSMLTINSLDLWINGWRKNGWKTSGGTAVKNLDLLQAIVEQRKTIKVYFDHVKGHAGIEGNEAADALARQGAAQFNSTEAWKALNEKAQNYRPSTVEEDVIRNERPWALAEEIVYRSFPHDRKYNVFINWLQKPEWNIKIILETGRNQYKADVTALFYAMVYAHYKEVLYVSLYGTNEILTKVAKGQFNAKVEKDTFDRIKRRTTPDNAILRARISLLNPTFIKSRSVLEPKEQLDLYTPITEEDFKEKVSGSLYVI